MTTITATQHWLENFTTITWQEFLDDGAKVSGFKETQWSMVQRMKVGDLILGYLTGLKRWIAVLQVTGEPYQDDTPIWKDDLYPCRVPVKVITALTPETGVPVLEMQDVLSVFQGLKGPNLWTGAFRGSPRKWKDEDGQAVVEAIQNAAKNPVSRPIDVSEKEETGADFGWIPFYEEMATRLVAYRDRQQELIDFLQELKNEGLPVPRLEDQDEAKDIVPLAVMDPFTFFGSFNRSTTEENRISIVKRMKTKFGVQADVPSKFAGVPVLDNRNSWFFGWQHGRKPNDVGELWDLFEAAVKSDPLTQPEFRKAFNVCTAKRGLRFKLTMGLFWIRPKEFLNLDGVNRKFLKLTLPKDELSFDDYAALLKRIKQERRESFPEISQAAWIADKDIPTEEKLVTVADAELPDRIEYSINDSKEEGLFLPESKIVLALDRLREKQNLILQGAPGVGKTFFARKLAYLLLGEKNDDRVRMVQFHPSYSYEDFVRGYRPTASNEGSKFTLQDGPFIQICKQASADLDNDYVLIIDEVNRANLSQVFGELFMLLEVDQRQQPVTLMYGDGKAFVVPKNLFLIGTMNTADRSLALVDFALRRRFAFLTLEPCFEQESFSEWLLSGGMSPEIVTLICKRMDAINGLIASDNQLGESYCIGHSFFCPRQSFSRDFSDRDHSWYQEVIDTEIIPLLREYWHENRAMLEKARTLLEQA